MISGDYYGLKTVVVENEFFRLECLAEAGPRIVRLIPLWTGENLFAELPKAEIPTPHGVYRLLGGHRLWTAPESFANTYLPDDSGLTFREITGGLRLTGAVGFPFSISKVVTVQMSSAQPFIIVKHKIINHGKTSVKIAPWAITMMRPKGTAVLPQQIGNVDDDGLLPNRRFALWPYSRWDDSRLALGNEFITLKSDLTSNPFKIGYFNPHGWLGYVYDDIMFVKRFGVRRDEEYPDLGCNAEVYTNSQTLELESLGSLIELAPKTDIVHTETWEVYNLDALPKDLLGGKPINEILRG